MGAVKGSKQYQMVVVPYRPWYKAGVVCLYVVILVALGWLAYRYGMDQGLALRAEVVKERNEFKRQLDQSTRLVEHMRQEIANLKVGGEIDARANEEVRQTVETLQDQIAELKEEIRFYKGVMLPNADETGLRIERLTLKPTGEVNKVEYSLLLTQLVDKHEYIQGGVEVNVVGMQNGAEKTFPLSQISDEEDNSIRFRFRYFQNVDGEMTIPEGFEPKEVMIVARSSGRNAQTLEKKFKWQLSGG